MAEYIECEAHCKKCIHHDICDSYSGFDIVTFFPHNEDCEYFKPTADVVEVRHGEWISYLDGDHIMPERYYQCSECKVRGYARRYNYCPYCGAKMDGGK